MRPFSVALTGAGDKSRRRAHSIVSFANCNRDGALALESSPERCPASDRWPLHDDEAGALQMPDQPFCYEVRQALRRVHSESDASFAAIGQGYPKGYVNVDT